MILGQHLSDETRAKMSAARKGRKKSPEWRAKMSALLMGRIMSPETRAKMSAAWIGKTGSLARRWKGGPGVWRRKQRAKRRTLGFIPLNEPFAGCEGHHLDHDRVVYIPEELHRSVSHDVWTGRNMDKINAIARQYLMEAQP